MLNVYTGVLHVLTVESELRLFTFSPYSIPMTSHRHLAHALGGASLLPQPAATKRRRAKPTLAAMLPTIDEEGMWVLAMHAFVQHASQLPGPLCPTN